MNKIKFVERLLKKLGKDSEDVIIVPYTERQKIWRDSKFDVHSKNKESQNRDVVIYDEKKPKKKDLPEGAENVIFFCKLSLTIDSVENIVNEIVNSNIDYRNKIGFDFPEKLTNFKYRKAIVHGDYRVFIYSNEINLNRVSIDEDRSISNVWISALKNKVSEKEKELGLKDKDIEALERHLEKLKEDQREMEKELKEEKNKLKTEIKENKKKSKEMEEQNKKLKREKEKNEKQLSKKLEDTRHEIKELKTQNQKEVSELKDKKEQEIKKLIEEKNKLKQSNEEHQKEIERLKRKKAEEINKIKSDVHEDIKELRQEKEQEIKKLRREREELIKELREAKSSLGYKITSSLTPDKKETQNLS